MATVRAKAAVGLPVDAHWAAEMAGDPNGFVADPNEPVGVAGMERVCGVGVVPEFPAEKVCGLTTVVPESAGSALAEPAFTLAPVLAHPPRRPVTSTPVAMSDRRLRAMLAPFFAVTPTSEVHHVPLFHSGCPVDEYTTRFPSEF